MTLQLRKKTHTLPKTNIFAPEKLPKPKGKDRLPTNIFEVPC